MPSTATNVIFIDKNNDDYKNAINFLTKLPSISLDTETTGVDPLINKILLISAGNQMKQYVFDIAKLEPYLDPLRKVLNDENKTFLLHNAKFDYKFLKHCLGIVLENIYDSMLVEMLLLKGRRQQGFGLDDVADKYLNIKLNKSIRKSFTEMKYGDSFTKDQIKYSGMDVQYLESIRQKQWELIKKYKLEIVYDIEMKAIPPTGDMELNGMYLSPALWSKAETQAIVDRDAAKAVLDKIVAPFLHKPVKTTLDLFANTDDEIPHINYNSPKQLLPILKEAIGTDADDLDSTGEPALKVLLTPGVYERIEKEQLNLLNDVYLTNGDKVIVALLVYREKEKRITTYGIEFLENIHPATGRIHSDFSQLFTDTGRFSSSNPNMQNVPRAKQYRTAFTAWHPDYRIINADYKGMELGILADLTQEPSWVDCFKRGGDLHAENGSIILGKPIRKKGTNGPNDPGENWELRQAVKSLNFGIGYGLGPGKLARETGISYEEAKVIIKKFWNTFTRIKSFFDEHVDQSFKSHCVRSPYDNRLRWLDGFDYDARKDQSRMRNLCMNFPMQAGNASITKHAMYLIRKDLKGKNAKIISTIHDKLCCV